LLTGRGRGDQQETKCKVVAAIRHGRP
jgi:hypothetical protein